MNKREYKEKAKKLDWGNLLFFLSGCSVLLLNTFSAVTLMLSLELFPLLLFASLRCRTVQKNVRKYTNRKVLLLAALVSVCSVLSCLAANYDRIASAPLRVLYSSLAGAGGFYFVLAMICLLRSACSAKPVGYRKILVMPKRDVLLLIGIITGVLLFSFFFLLQKSGFHVDENYTFGLSNSYYEPFLYTSGGDQYLAISGDVYKEYLTVGTHPFSYISVMYNQIHDVHPPLYYFCVHTLCSFFPNIPFSLTGWLINAGFAAVSLTVMFVWGRHRFGIRTACIMTISYGTCSGFLSITMLSRMYTAMSFFTLLLFVLVFELYRTENVRLFRWIALTLCFGAFTQYFFLIYAVLLAVVTAALWLIKKKWDLIKSLGIVSLSSALIYYAVWGGGAATAMMGTSLGETLLANAETWNGYQNSLRYLLMIFRQFLSSNAIFGTLLLLITGAGILLLVIQTIRRKNTERFLLCFLAFFPTTLTFLMIAKITPYLTERYIFFLLPVFWISFWILADTLISKKNVRAVFSVLILACCIATVDPEYLYTDTAQTTEYLSSLSENTVCIYYSEDGNLAEEYSSCYLMNYSVVLSVKPESLESLQGAEEVLEADGPVILITEDTTIADWVAEQFDRTAVCVGQFAVGAAEGYDGTWVFELEKTETSLTR